jgi:hypothetical protein
MTDYRASFDAAINFSNGGGLAVHGFRADLPSADTTRPASPRSSWPRSGC